MNDEVKLFGFLLSKLGITENEVRWMYHQGVSFRKDEWFIRKILFEDISLPKCFLQELEENTLKKEEIFNLLNITDQTVDTFFEDIYLDKNPQYPKYDFEKMTIIYSSELKWSLFKTTFTNKYNLLSYYETNKEIRNRIMKKLHEKGIDFSQIGDIFNYSSRSVRDILSKL